MNVYPITFMLPDGTLIAGELVTEVSLINQFWSLVPANNGNEYSAYPGGTPPPPPPNPSWQSQLPNELNLSAAYSVNVITTYCNPTSNITLQIIVNGTLGGALPTGVTFDGTTLAYDGTHVVAATQIAFVETLSPYGTTSTSNTFTLSGIGSVGADTTAPAVPVIIAASNIAQTTATLSGIASSDPSPSSAQWSGMKQYNIAVTGAPGSPFTVNAPGLGIKASLTLGDIGAQTSNISQSGSTLTFTTNAVDSPYPTNSALAAAYIQISGQSGTISAKVPGSFASPGGFDNLRLELRPTLSPTGAYAAIYCTPFGGPTPVVGSEARASSGGNDAGISSAATSGGPVEIFISWSGSTITFFWAADGITPQPLGSTTLALGSSFYAVFGANTSAGAQMVAQQLQQCSVTVDPNWSLALTGLTANTAYPVSVTAQDVANNVSAASGAMTFTTAPVGGGGGGGGGTVLFPLSYSAAIGAASNQNSAIWLNAAAKFNLLSVLGFSTFASALGRTLNSWMSDIKTRAAGFSNATCNILQYQMEEDFFTNNTVPGFFDNCMLDMLNAHPTWWLTSTWPTTTKVTGDPNHSVLQMTSSCPSYNISTVGSVGGPGLVNCAQFEGWKEYQQLVLGKYNALNSKDPSDATNNAANPTLNGMFHDNIFMIPRYAGNWLCTPTYYTYGVSNMAAVIHPLAQGYSQICAEIRSLKPPLLQMGNCDHIDYAGSSGTAAIYDPASNGLYDFALAEHLANGAGTEAAASWPNFLVAMQKYEQLIAPGGFPIVGVSGNPTQDGWTSKLQSQFTVSDWQVWRYAIGLSLLMRWYVEIANYDSANMKWYDELDCGGLLGVNWLGAPSGSRNLTTPWLSAGAHGTYGVWKADFAHGSAIINPRGNTAQTFNMPYTGRFIAYTANHSNPAYALGSVFSTASTFTLQPRDCIVVRNFT